jgi:hypothetical protein
MTPALGKLLADLGVWVRATDVPPARSQAGRLREAIANLEAENDPRGGWNAVMRDSLLLRLRELVDIRQDMRDLRSHIEAGGGGTPHYTTAVHIERRSIMLTIVALPRLCAAALTILLLCTFYRDAGSRRRRRTVAAAACSLFAALDDPTPMLKNSDYAVLSIAAGLACSPSAAGRRLRDAHARFGAFFVPVGVLMASRQRGFFHRAQVHNRNATELASTYSRFRIHADSSIFFSASQAWS